MGAIQDMCLNDAHKGREYSPKSVLLAKLPNPPRAGIRNGAKTHTEDKAEDCDVSDGSVDYRGGHNRLGKISAAFWRGTWGRLGAEMWSPCIG
jgi:hypothetical protein